MLEQSVLFAGEEIIDLYHYGHLIGRPLKDPVLALQYERTEGFRGGIQAAAGHARDFCHTEVFSTVSITKERYLDEAHLRKLFEFCRTPRVRSVKRPDWNAYDLIAIIDYGHGMFDETLIRSISTGAKFLALNVQTNSANYGFNLVTRWPQARYLVMDEAEARLAAGVQFGDIREAVRRLASRAQSIVVTLGGCGALGWSESDGFIEAPACTTQVIDTLGAGDAFFAVSALFAPQLPLAQLLEIGNAAGAAKTQITGHRQAVTRARLAQWLP